MAAIFAGASRALLASVVFAFETTRQPLGLLPLLGGCTAAYLVSCAADAQHDHDREDRAPRRARARPSTPPTSSTRCWCATPAPRRGRRCAPARSWARCARWSAPGAPNQHQGFPVVDDGRPAARRGHPPRPARPVAAEPAPHRRRWCAPPVVVSEHIAARRRRPHGRENVGRLLVVGDDAPHPLIGILTRSDLLAAHGQRLRETRQAVCSSSMRCCTVCFSNWTTASSSSMRQMPSSPGNACEASFCSATHSSRSAKCSSSAPVLMSGRCAHQRDQLHQQRHAGLAQLAKRYGGASERQRRLLQQQRNRAAHQAALRRGGRAARCARAAPAVRCRRWSARRRR